MTHRQDLRSEDRRDSSLPASVRRYVGTWVLVATSVAGGVVALDVRGGVPAPSVWLLATLWCGLVVAGLFTMRVRLFGAVDEATTMLEVALVPAMVLLSPAWAVVMAVTALPIVEARQTRGHPTKMAFNVAMKLTGTALGAGAHGLVSGAAFTASPVDVLGAMTAAGTFAVVTVGAYTGLLAVLGGERVRDLVPGEALTILALDGGMAVAGVLVAVVATTAPVALPLLAVPTVLDVLRARARQERHELAAAARAAEAANEAKSTFLSGMSHELRTPLNAILGFGQLLEADQRLEADARHYVEVILQSGRHLVALVDEVLDISRIESGRLDVATAPVAVGPAVRECLELTRPMADDRGIRLHVDIPTEAVYAMADPQRLAQVLINLVSNAIKYNREDGDVVISVHRRDDEVAVSVTDTGQGIAPQDLERLFVPFDRLRADRTDTPGTGLGLSISRQLVEAMAGRLTVDSRPSEGSTFTVALAHAPHAAVDSAPAPAPTSGSRAKPADDELEVAARQPSGFRVVHVDADPARVVLVQRTLEQRPAIHVRPAVDTAAGLVLSRNERPHLVLLAVAPGTSTEAALQPFRNDPALADVPVAVLTTAQGQSVGALPVGAVATLGSPLDLQALLRLVDELAAVAPAPA